MLWDRVEKLLQDTVAWLPKTVAGLCLICGPVVLLAGWVLQVAPRLFASEILEPYLDDPTYFRQELALFEEYPVVMMAGYGLTLLGMVLLLPAVAGLAGLIAERNYTPYAVAGGLLAGASLLPRLFHTGVETFAVELLYTVGFEEAATAVGDMYGPISGGPLGFGVIFGAARLVGWPLLAMGAWKSKTVGPVGAAVLVVFAFHRQGVLKGSSLLWIGVVAALCAVLLPLGVRLLRSNDGPERDKP